MAVCDLTSAQPPIVEIHPAEMIQTSEKHPWLQPWNSRGCRRSSADLLHAFSGEGLPVHSRRPAGALQPSSVPPCRSWRKRNYISESAEISFTWEHFDILRLQNCCSRKIAFINQCLIKSYAKIWWIFLCNKVRGHVLQVKGTSQDWTALLCLLQLFRGCFRIQ